MFCAKWQEKNVLNSVSKAIGSVIRTFALYNNWKKMKMCTAQKYECVLKTMNRKTHFCKQMKNNSEIMIEKKARTTLRTNEKRNEITESIFIFEMISQLTCFALCHFFHLDLTVLNIYIVFPSQLLLLSHYNTCPTSS